MCRCSATATEISWCRPRQFEDQTIADDFVRLDHVQVETDSSLPFATTIRTADGDDRVAILGAQFDHLQVNTGSGDDSLRMRNSSWHFTGSLYSWSSELPGIDLGAGRDALVLLQNSFDEFFGDLGEDDDQAVISQDGARGTLQVVGGLGSDLLLDHVNVAASLEFLGFES